MLEVDNPFEGGPNQENEKQILPANVRPTHYDVQLEPDLENASFDGSVIIHFDVLEESTFIVLNSVQLDISSTEILDSSGAVTRIPKVHYDEVQQTVLVPLSEPLLAGSSIQLHQTFRGVLNDIQTMSGFMRSSYKDSDGKSKWIGSTQGQPTGIRQIFPCADEPALKATLTAALVVDEDLTCLSNMDIASSTANSAGKKKVVFNKTPPMSTYLVVFIVGELNYIESNKFRVPVRVYATPDMNISGGKFALDVGERAMILHEKTFALPYPLPKLDMVAVPGQIGGMENWGCVMFNEKSLVRDEDDGSARGSQAIAIVVIHELAHQWFGNIVTPAWWDALWLNESFADWATYNAITQLFPDWDSWSDFVAAYPDKGGFRTYQAALTLDANLGSHPIEVPLNTPDQISQVFDAITYAKGSSVLRMLSDYLGVDCFIKGIQRHLRKHTFGNATTNELWDSLSIVSGKDVRMVMAVWTEKVGYPVLTVTEDEKTDTIEVSQQRFIESGRLLPEDAQLIYPIYLKTKSQNGTDEKAHLFDRKGDFSVDFKFYKLNTDQTGLYRVSYPPSRLEKFGSQLSSGLLSPNDRVGLLSDLRAMVGSGHSSKVRTSNLFSFLNSFRGESNYFVWRQLLVCFQELRTAWMFENSATLQGLQAFQMDLMNPILMGLGEDLWHFKPSHSYNTQNLMKAILFSNASGYAPVKQVSRSLFERFMAGEQKVLNPNIRQAVFKYVLSDGEATSSQVRFPTPQQN